MEWRVTWLLSEPGLLCSQSLNCRSGSAGRSETGKEISLNKSEINIFISRRTPTQLPTRNQMDLMVYLDLSTKTLWTTGFFAFKLRVLSQVNNFSAINSYPGGINRGERELYNGGYLSVCCLGVFRIKLLSPYW